MSEDGAFHILGCRLSNPVDLPAVPHPVQPDFLPDNVVPNPVGPDLQAPLTYSLSLELLNLGGQAGWIRLEASDRVEDFLLTRLGEVVEIALETWGQANRRRAGISQPARRADKRFFR